MKLLLHGEQNSGELAKLYKRAFTTAQELYIVSAYLTEWDNSLRLNSHCRRFRLIIGKDFGITRKAACEKVMKWLPAGQKTKFMVADRIPGFHPKAVFWKEGPNDFFAIIGSSNLTRAAFETNYEVNLYCKLSSQDYSLAKKWTKGIEKQSLSVSDDWLKRYKEAPQAQRPKADGKSDSSSSGLASFPLPTPAQMSKYIASRRRQLANYCKHRKGLISLFRRCAAGQISSNQFYETLPRYWSYELDDRLQGRGFERSVRRSDFQKLSRSFVKIIEADGEDRDDVVAEEIDRLATAKVSTRGAFLSEMLCLNYPADYPVLNNPVKDYLADIELRAPRGASEGAKYIDLAQKLRLSLLQNPAHPAKTIAELDTVIWLQYGDS